MDNRELIERMRKVQRLYEATSRKMVADPGAYRCAAHDIRELCDALEALEAERERLEDREAELADDLAAERDICAGLALKVRNSERRVEEVEGVRVRLFRKLRRIEAERERLQRRLNATETALAKGRYLDAEIIGEMPDVTLAEVMWEIGEEVVGE